MEGAGRVLFEGTSNMPALAWRSLGWPQSWHLIR